VLYLTGGKNVKAAKFTENEEQQMENLPAAITIALGALGQVIGVDLIGMKAVGSNPNFCLSCFWERVYFA
jgi:hypothetical protein